MVTSPQNLALMPDTVADFVVSAPLVAVPTTPSWKGEVGGPAAAGAQSAGRPSAAALCTFTSFAVAPPTRCTCPVCACAVAVASAMAGVCTVACARSTFCSTRRPPTAASAPTHARTTPRRRAHAATPAFGREPCTCDRTSPFPQSGLPPAEIVESLSTRQTHYSLAGRAQNFTPLNVPARRECSSRRAASIPDAMDVHVLVRAGVFTGCVGPGIWLPGM